MFFYEILQKSVNHTISLSIALAVVLPSFFMIICIFMSNKCIRNNFELILVKMLYLLQWLNGSIMVIQKFLVKLRLWFFTEDIIKMYLWDDKQERKIHEDFQQDEQQTRTNQKKVNKVDLSMKFSWNKQPKQHLHVSMSMWNKQVGLEQSMSTRSTTLHGPYRSMEEITLHGGENMLAWLLTWSQTKTNLACSLWKELIR